ncbi:hypothetical protein B0T25DRAFT_516308 [Lasiosphaeria hispida]|uniref:Protein kinase domain-containing protein n=1 Tax=Lasiosphaeria hispida TaxID=260671 RepID=A0AAJ0HKX4_9PEZI|nr:hypothetical protein B0T25DRAFT_516308 [Lasiosphaeria hispida]
MPLPPPKVPAPTGEFGPHSAGKLLRPPSRPSQGRYWISTLVARPNRPYPHLPFQRRLMPTTTYRHYVEGGIILLSQPVNNPTQQPNSQPETLSGFSPLDQRQRGGGPQIIDEKYFADSDKESAGAASPVLPYRAPEVDVPGAILGPSYDIWALGCVYLEFVAWYLRGWEGVQHFETERSTLDSHRAYRGIKTPTFFTVDKSANPPKPVVKEEAVKYIDSLRADPEVPCARFFHEFLDAIQKELLVADLSGGGQRMSANHIVGTLDYMLNGDYYCTTPAVRHDGARGMQGNDRFQSTNFEFHAPFWAVSAFAIDIIVFIFVVSGRAKGEIGGVTQASRSVAISSSL